MESSGTKSEKFTGESFDAFLEAVPDAMLAVDGRGIIVAVNSQTEGLFGYSRRELLGKNMELLVPERMRDKHVGQLRGYMVSPRPRPMGVGKDLVGRHKSGAEIPVEISLSPLKTAKAMLVLAAMRDVTDRRQAQETLKVAQAQLELKVAERTSELLSANKALRHEIDDKARLEREIRSVSEREQQRIGQDLHDNLGQTLTAVTYIGQLLFKKIGEDTPAGKDAAEIVKLVSGAIDQVRLLSRGLYPVQLQTNGLVPALQEMVAAAEAKWRIPCSMKYDDPDPVKDPDAAIQLYRIAQEAVTNASKHAKPKHITVRLSTADDEVKLEVEDDGVGFPLMRRDDGGMGMHIMKYRATTIGASFDVQRRERGGTAVACVWRGRGK